MHHQDPRGEGGGPWQHWRDRNQVLGGIAPSTIPPGHQNQRRSPPPHPQQPNACRSCWDVAHLPDENGRSPKHGVPGDAPSGAQQSARAERERTASGVKEERHCRGPVAPQDPEGLDARHCSRAKPRALSAQDRSPPAAGRTPPPASLHEAISAKRSGNPDRCTVAMAFAEACR